MKAAISSVWQYRTVAAWAILVFAGTTTGVGHEEHAAAPQIANPAEVHRPTVMPDRIVLTWSEDPTTTQAVTWRTSTEVVHGFAEIAVAEAGPAFPNKARRVPAVAEPLKTDLGEAHYHSVRFEGLQPATKYAYRVGDGQNWSEWFHFQTASAQAGTLFIHLLR